ncbi:MAG: hypothetical protein HC924_06030 [Synechococcaceae cyanobacterium SM2_3_2]|nr:hypothetical protein [Synechococcaceae cyanobacterium SM2_3_2]
MAPEKDPQDKSSPETPKGFGKPTRPVKKPPTAAAKKRKVAEKKYENLQGDGYPEFNIYVRLPEKPENWLPVGSMAVKRSGVINQAIFQNEADLLKGAMRVFPRLAKRQEELEYGYRLKDKAFQDEPIQLAQRPQPSAIAGLMAKIQGLFSRKN